MAPEQKGKSRIIGDLRTPPEGESGGDVPGPDEPVDVVIELNATYPGPASAAHDAFADLWHRFVERVAPAGGAPKVLFQKTRIARKLYQCILTRSSLAVLMEMDEPGPTGARIIFRAWPDYELYAHIDRSAATVKVDAARRSFSALGEGIVWAVIDTGIDQKHPHFSALELAREGTPDAAPTPKTGGLHRDFSGLVRPSLGTPTAPADPLADEEGHGTHVAGIIAGGCPEGRTAHVASSDEAVDGGFVPRAHAGALSGMAPLCQLVSLKVFRRVAGVAVTSSSAVIAAIEYVLTEVNVSRNPLRVHGVNLSLGCDWDPSHYAAGQSPLDQLLTELVATGVNVVVSAGNNGSAAAAQSANQSTGVLASITEPGHTEACITVGSTHRDAPHVFGVSWTSSKGPTLDGRAKPDVVAPGEWICSAATGTVRTRAGLDGLTGDDASLTYAELSGTSMAAPHVSGVIAAFLSGRPEYIGRAAEVKALLLRSALDLGRDRYGQGAGLADAMAMLTNY
ncbi:S8 family serine peptidase [Sinomonas sp. ASV486]|uniref:S8 family serine peptidase n=1 Tax=Sinomonas puerhi TaxID=3238584 RepID=A0AB39L439_9MICC|nr:S8 family serine peptidase [Sinomonas sp. ASV486]MDQ4491336.1 S8 family serine peptidase [Sinomonas sp. ASV486]